MSSIERVKLKYFENVKDVNRTERENWNKVEIIIKCKGCKWDFTVY